MRWCRGDATTDSEHIQLPVVQALEALAKHPKVAELMIRTRSVHGGVHVPGCRCPRQLASLEGCWCATVVVTVPCGVLSSAAACT
jgi:hypothetical protein